MANSRTILVAMAAVCLLSSCSWWRRHGDKCREPVVPANTQNLPPLKAPPGLSAPDTRNGIKVPELPGEAKPHGKSDPCLSKPPTYGS
jgi:uncharacterized lipoprotein